MHAGSAGTIVVGFDGSDDAEAALRYALDLGAELDAAVDAVTSWHWPTHFTPVQPSYHGWTPLSDAEEIRQHAQEVIDGAQANAAAHAVEGDAAAALVEASTPDGMLVVGTRGRGGVRSLLLGSVSAAVVQRAPCPVLVHRGSRMSVRDGDRPVLVGVDGSESSEAALRVALGLARRLGVGVHVVTAWRWPSAMVREDAEALDWSPVDGAQEDLATALEHVGEDVGDVDVVTEMAEGSPAEVLLERASEASLLVVGRRGLGALRGLLIGSVSAECIRSAACPVLVGRD